MIKYLILILIFSSMLFSQKKIDYSLENNSFQTRQKDAISDNLMNAEPKSDLTFIFGIRDELIFMSVNIRNNQTNAMFLPINIHLIQGIKFFQIFQYLFYFWFISIFI